MASFIVSSLLMIFNFFSKAQPVFLTTMPSIFGETYHERVGIIGLNYFALGIGLVGASQLNASFMDKVYIYFKTRNEGVGEPEFRLREFQVPLSPMMAGH